MEHHQEYANQVLNGMADITVVYTDQDANKTSNGMVLNAYAHKDTSGLTKDVNNVLQVLHLMVRDVTKEIINVEDLIVIIMGMLVCVFLDIGS